MSGNSESLRVKICGMTRLEDAQLALDFGAWALGFIFHEPSPRSIHPDEAQKIRAQLPDEAKTIGVFVDRSPEEIQAVVDQVGLHGVQFHGRETPADLEAVNVALKVKAFRVGEQFEPSALDAYPDIPILLDTYRKGLPGGTGETFDWEVAKSLSTQRQIILAGGIGVSNAVEVIEVAHPWALDVSSQLESEPGIKDPTLVRELFNQIHSSGRSSEAQ